MSIENKKTLDVYKNTAHTYLLNNIENDKLDPVKAQKSVKNYKNLSKCL